MAKTDLDLLFSHRCRDYAFVLRGDVWVCPICGTPYPHSYPFVEADLYGLPVPVVLYWKPWQAMFLYHREYPRSKHQIIWRPWQVNPYVLLNH